jgi:hypothetical protein
MEAQIIDGASKIVAVQGLWVHLWLHGETNPTAELWEANLEEGRRVMLENKVSIRQYRSLVFSDGAAPNARQRDQLNRNLHRGHAAPTSVVTDALSNPIKRGVATALQWLNPAFRFYLPGDIAEALAHLGLASAWHDLLPHLRALQGRVVPVRALREAEQAMSGGPRLPR